MIAPPPPVRSLYRPDGFELWRGPSAFDGTEVGVVVTHTRRSPQNRKIGDMAQAWVLPVETAPLDAVLTGADAAVCGSCRFRPAAEGGCYVPLAQTAQRVWWAWQVNGSYGPGLPVELGAKPVRIGAWGDPAAVPLEAWLLLLDRVPAWTAYTHRWRQVPDAEREGWQMLAMASADSAEEADEARALGWRTFRARRSTDPLLPGERVCPSAVEAPSYGRATCSTCRLCDGVRARRAPDIAIVVHGRSARLAAGVVGRSS